MIQSERHEKSPNLVGLFLLLAAALVCLGVVACGGSPTEFKPLSEDSVVMLIGSLATPPTPWLSTLERRIRVAADSGVDTVILCVYTNCVEDSYEELDRILNLAAESGVSVVPRVEATSDAFSEWIPTTAAGPDRVADYTVREQLDHAIALMNRVIDHLDLFPNVVAYQVEWGHWGESWVNAPFWNSPSSKQTFLEFLYGLTSDFERFDESNIDDWVDGEIMFHSTFLPDGDVRRDPINVAEYYWYQLWRDEMTREITWTFREAAQEMTDKPIAGFSYVNDSIGSVYTADRHLDIALSDWTAVVAEAFNRCCTDFLRDAHFSGLHLAEYDFDSQYFARNRAEEAIASLYSRGIIPVIFYPHWVDEIDDADIPIFVDYIDTHKGKMASVESGDVLVVYGHTSIGLVDNYTFMTLAPVGWPLTSNDPAGLLKTMFDGGLTIDIVDADVYSPTLGDQYSSVVVVVPSDSIDHEFQNRISQTHTRVIVAHPSFLVGTPTVDSPTTVTSAIYGMWNPLLLDRRDLRAQVRGNNPGATIGFQGKLTHLGQMTDYQANHLFSYYEGSFDEVYATARMDGYVAPVIARIGNIIFFGLDVHIFDDAHRATCQEAFLQLLNDETMWTGSVEDDRDGDGVPDDEDFCPDWPGSVETSGC